jgi:hypothetical protein
VSEPAAETWRQALTVQHLVGVVAGVLGFVVGVTAESRDVVDGVVVSCTSLDWGALIAGTVGILAGTMATARTIHRPTADHRVLLFAVAIAVQLVGMVHVARGLGIIGGSC